MERILMTIVGLGLLMVIHEGGHLLVARAFGMRVIRFSIGFGPSLWRYQPKGSDTVYQVALIPFLAYVQIAGMNPFEEADPEDRGSYANASLPARISTLFAGPFANYLFASVLFFAAFMIGGKPGPDPMVIEVTQGGAAAQGQMQDGDRIVEIGGSRVDDFESMKEIVLEHADKPLTFVVERGGANVELLITPEPKAPEGKGLIGVRPASVPMGIGEAAEKSIIAPARVVQGSVIGIAQWATGKSSLDVAGPIGIVKHGAKTLQGGMSDFLQFLGVLSAFLGAFNLAPLPALDGGRLMFLGYEAVTRRKPNARIEAQIHAVGLLMFLMLMVFVSFYDFKRGDEGLGAPPPKEAAPATSGSAAAPAAESPAP